MKQVACFLLILVLSLAGCKQKEAGKLTIAVSSNMQYAAEEIVEAFSVENSIPCQLIISSSGKLTAQIMEGAPYDVFLSADRKYPLELYNKGFSTLEPEIYAYGKLILWSLKDNVIPSLDLLTTAETSKVAIANPKIAPYGIAALEVLEFYDIYDEVENKLVYGESIAQTNQFISTKAVEIGFTSLSTIRSPYVPKTGNWIEISPESYNPIAQAAVIIDRNRTTIQASKNFYDFLFSEKARNILNKFGYSTVIK